MNSFLQPLHPDHRHPVGDDHVGRVHAGGKLGRIVRFHHHVHGAEADIRSAAAFRKADDTLNGGIVICRGPSRQPPG
jgi:hypothetical protein